MATVTAGYNWVSGETVTPTKLNSAAAPTVVVADSEVTAAKIADASVTTAKIADANVTPAKLSQPLTVATSQATTSGTSIDFTGIPSWVKRITVMFNAVSTTPNNSNDKIIRVGTATGIVSSGYKSTSIGIQSAATGSVSSTEGFRVAAGGFADEMSGHLLLTNVSGNVWVCSGTAKTNTGYMILVAGDVSLSATLDRIRLTTVNGTDTFDAGSVNIIYEG